MELKRWDTGEVIFEMGCATFRELVEGSIKAGVTLYRADMRGANMRYANMSDANMLDADMRGADMRGANMRYTLGNMIELKTLALEKYVVTFNDSHMAIGCQQHTIEEWFEFTDDRISQMDHGALEWWKKWKDFIFTAIEMTKEA